MGFGPVGFEQQMDYCVDRHFVSVDVSIKRLVEVDEDTKKIFVQGKRVAEDYCSNTIMKAYTVKEGIEIHVLGHANRTDDVWCEGDVITLHGTTHNAHGTSLTVTRGPSTPRSNWRKSEGFTFGSISTIRPRILPGFEKKYPLMDAGGKKSKKV